MSSHTLSVLVEDKPGVLARIAGLFSRRGFNIESLAVGPTEHSEISRMTIVVNVADSPLEQVTKMLNKLVEVIKIVELDQDASVHRELVLVKVAATAETRGQILDVVQLFRASVIDVATDAVTIQVIGNAAKIADVLKILEPFGIRELVQSGMVAIGRGSRSISDGRSPSARCARWPCPPRRPLGDGIPTSVGIPDVLGRCNGPEPPEKPEKSAHEAPPIEGAAPWLRCSTTTTPTWL